MNRAFYSTGEWFTGSYIMIYWQASQVPPFSMASMEQAFFSATVYCLASAAVAAV